MFFKSLALTALVLSTGMASAADIFKVAPYTLKHTNGRLLLNFQLNETRKLQIQDGQKVSKSFEYKKDQHYQTELGTEACGGVKDLRIVDANNSAVVFSKSFPESICSNAASDYTFGFISDTQQYTNRHEAIAKIIAYHNAQDPMQFLINGGDVVQNGQVESEWIEYFKGGISYLMDIPQIAAIGNHDYRGNKKDVVVPEFFQKYLRWENSPKDGNLFFDMPGFQLIILNSNFSDFSEAQEKETWVWMENKMDAAQKARTPLVVATHFPVFSSSMNRFTSSSVKLLKKHLMPLAEKYGVKLILSGHTHMYERSFKDGVNYLVAGPAGGRVNKPTGPNKYKQYFNANVLTFTKIKYSNRTFKVETFNEENVLIDQLHINL